MTNSSDWMLTKLFWGLIVVAVLFFIYARPSWVKALFQNKKSSLKKSKNPTMFDVRHWIIEGENQKATAIYQKLFKVSLKDAQKAVEDMAKNIRGKKSPLQ